MIDLIHVCLKTDVINGYYPQYLICGVLMFKEANK
jgi:hypothetical protein